MHRRHFLRTAGLGLCSLGALGALTTTGCTRRAAATPEDTVAIAPAAAALGGRVLVLVELAGGNDGLNTVVPLRDPAYRAARPSLAIERDAALALDDAHGLHPALRPLAAHWDAGQLAVVHGLGYPEPNRSHFRSIEIWETGSASDDVVSEGWIERVLAAAAPAGLAADGVMVGHDEPGPLAGERLRALSMQRPEDFVREARRLQVLERAPHNPALDHAIGVQNELVEAARVIERRLGEAAAPAAVFPQTRLGRQLAVAARLITAGVPIGVVTVRHGGFDTHAGQPGVHERLLGQLADALDAFARALQAGGCWNSTLVATWSEFGRRVAENGSGGTDHGTAAPQFLLGGTVRGGLHGTAPDLERLDDNGDLVHTTDFRALYDAIATQWWQLEAPFGVATAAALDLVVT